MQCGLCDAGKVLAESRGFCERCAATEYLSAQTVQCIPCAAGEYAAPPAASEADCTAITAEQEVQVSTFADFQAVPGESVAESVPALQSAALEDVVVEDSGVQKLTLEVQSAPDRAMTLDDVDALRAWVASVLGVEDVGRVEFVPSGGGRRLLSEEICGVNERCALVFRVRAAAVVVPERSPSTPADPVDTGGQSPAAAPVEVSGESPAESPAAGGSAGGGGDGNGTMTAVLGFAGFLGLVAISILFAVCNQPSTSAGKASLSMYAVVDGQAFPEDEFPSEYLVEV